MKQVLITGMDGFIGSNLMNFIPGSIGVTRNINHYDDKSILYCNLESQLEVRNIFKFYQPDVIIHCAANPNPKHPENHVEMINDNIVATANLLEYCKPNTQFIFLSSVLVYGDSFPVIAPTNLYGATKVASEAMVKAYSKLGDLETTSIRMCAVVGNNTTHGLLYDIKRKLQSDSEYLELFGDEPGTRKPFAHIDDLIVYIKKLINGKEKFIDTIDFGPTDNMSVKEVAECIMNKIKIKKPIKWLGNSTIWKGDNRNIKTSYIVDRVPLLYDTSYKAIYNAI